MTHPVVLAVDVGGTSFKGALVDTDGRTLHAETVPVAGMAGDTATAALTALSERLMATATARNLRPLAAGVVAPGVDENSGHVMFASNLGWRDLPLRAILEARLGLPVATGHDVRTAGLAEGAIGAGRGARDFAFVMIGTGIAAALVTGGACVVGARRQGGEFGHAPVHPDGELCGCGQRGCLEAYASASAIARRYRAGGGVAPLTAAEIGLAQGEDPLARRVWGEAVTALSLGLATLTMLLDPALFILGGGLVEAGPLLLDPLGVALEERLSWRAAPPLRRSLLGTGAARLGAAILAFGLVDGAANPAEWRLA